MPVGGREGGRGEQAEPRGSQGIETTLYDAVTADTCHLNFSKPVGYTPPRGSPNVNYGLWVTVMCQCRLTDCECTTQVGDADSEGDCGVRGKSLYFVLDFTINLKQL